MRNKKKCDGSDDGAVPCGTLDRQLMSGLEHVSVATPHCEYSVADESQNCGDALSLDYEDYSGALQPSSQDSHASIGAHMDFGDISWASTPDLSTSSNVPRLEMPLSPTSVDQSTSLLSVSPVVARPDVRNSRPGSGKSSQAPLAADRSSSAHAKLISKACGMVEELRKLYSLGVELELLQQESDVPAHLDAVEELIHRSGRDAQSRHGTMERGGAG